MTDRLQGVMTALVTPFTTGGELDEAALVRLVRRQIQGGVAGLVPAGTTGEAVTLSDGEYRRLIELVKRESEQAGRKVWVIAGAGTNDTRRTRELAKTAREAGADALLIVTPYYVKPTQQGLFEHFHSVADAGGLPVVLYNVPGRTGLNMTAETTLRLSEDPRFWGVKEASGSLDQVSEILRARPQGFAVLSGDDSLALPMIALGADGVISVLANEAPGQFTEMVARALDGRRAAAAELHARLFPLMKANFLESNPIPVKWALSRLGLIQNRLRLPLTPLASTHQRAVEDALRTAGLELPSEVSPA